MLALFYKLINVFRILRCEDGEKIFPTAGSTLGVLVWKVVGHALENDTLGIQIRDRYFIITRGIASLGLICLQELFLAADDLLEPLGVKHVVWRHIVLTIEKNDELSRLVQMILE